MDGEVEPATVAALLDDASVECIVVDIRSPRQFARGHIPGSVNVPMADLTNRVEEFTDADRIVTVCPHGQASVQAARLIQSYEGVEAPVESMAGGLTAYDGPIETGEETTDDDAGAPASKQSSTGASSEASAEGPDAPF